MAAGWYGKLPSVGDFVSRRLPPDWIAAWDSWLAEGLARMRDAAPDTWLDDYLASPAWRFALMPGVVDEVLRVGVLMPSVDSVGRYFPLVIVSAPLAPPRTLATAHMLWQWTAAVEDLAINALQQDWTVDTLEAALLDLGAPRMAPDDSPSLTSDFAATFSHLCADLTWQGLQACSVWFAPSGATAPMRAQGLPDRTLFQALFHRVA